MRHHVNDEVSAGITTKPFKFVQGYIYIDARKYFYKYSSPSRMGLPINVNITRKTLTFDTHIPAFDNFTLSELELEWCTTCRRVENFTILQTTGVIHMDLKAMYSAHIIKHFSIFVVIFEVIGTTVCCGVQQASIKCIIFSTSLPQF